MRVAHVITRLILGGAQENTLLNCEDLAREFGDDVLLATGPALGPEGSLMDRARGGPAEVVEVEALRRPIHPLRDLAAYRGVRAVLREFRPDVVHTHSAKGGVIGRLAASSLRIPAIVHTVHGAPFYPYQRAAVRELYRRIEQFAARRCHALVSVADAMTEQLVAAGVAPRDKFSTIYSGMEVEPFLAAGEHRRRVRESLGIGPDDVVVGKIARLFHLKGHEDVVAAAATACRQDPRLRFLFVGDGLLRPQIETQIRNAGLGDRFVLTGLVPPEQIPELLGSMDFVVHASLREGLARVLPQAMLAGLPAVSYDVDGAREVVLDRRTGRLLAARDVSGLAEAILELAADADLRAQWGAAGRELCREPFRHEVMTREIRALYKRLLGGAAAGGDAGQGRPDQPDGASALSD